MGDPFAHTDDNLGRAAWTAAFGIAGAAALSFVLDKIGIDRDFAVLFAYSAFLLVGWFMAKAARQLGRSPWLYGLVSIVPPLAIFAFISLYSRDMDARLARVRGSRHDA